MGWVLIVEFGLIWPSWEVGICGATSFQRDPKQNTPHVLTIRGRGCRYRIKFTRPGLTLFWEFLQLCFDLQDEWWAHFVFAINVCSQGSCWEVVKRLEKNIQSMYKINFIFVVFMLIVILLNILWIACLSFPLFPQLFLHQPTILSQVICVQCLAFCTT